MNRNRNTDKQDRGHIPSGKRRRNHGSADAVALYPNLDIKRSAKECAKEIVETDAEFKDINLRAALIYIGLNCDKDEVKKAGLEKLVPKHRVKIGPKPGMRNNEV